MNQVEAGKPFAVTSLDTDSSSVLRDFTVLPLGLINPPGNSQTLNMVKFPISLVKPEKIYDEKAGGDPNTILKYRVELIKASYATLDSKQQVVDSFNEKYPDCSKKSIERVFKEIIVKDKMEGDLRPVWYATPQILQELELDKDEEFRAELIELARLRMQPLIEEAEQAEAKKCEEQRLKEEKKRQEQAERDAERERRDREKQEEKER